MRKILIFGLKIKGVVGRMAHAKSSDPATPSKFAPDGVQGVKPQEALGILHFIQAKA